MFWVISLDTRRVKGEVGNVSASPSFFDDFMDDHLGLLVVGLDDL